MTTTTLVCLFGALLATSAAAQLPGPGLTWTGNLGGSAGSFLPTCTSLPVTTLRGETVTLRVWGDPGALFLLFVSTTATQCLPIPGVNNGLVLDLPMSTVAIGLLTQGSPCLSCPPAFEPLSFTVPLSLPPGLAVSCQAASFGANQPAFTVAVTATVQ